MPSASEIRTKVDEYMNAAVTVYGFSGSILVARNGQPVVSKGFGMANVELAVPNTPQTVFRLGSVTKQFTAMAIMILQERGKLRVSDPACQYLTDCPAAWQPLTIRHLLTHTSGIPNYTNFPDFARDGRPADNIRRHGRHVEGQAAGVRARREVRVQQFGLLPARIDHRARVRQALRRLPPGERSSRRSP